MRAAKWVAGILAGLALLAIALMLIVTLLVDPNRFKGRIEAMVQQASGSPFRIGGDLDIAWYPWLALKMGEARLGDAPPLVQWQSASFGARLIPLLRGRLIVDRVRLDGLRVHLERSADGRGNWEHLLAARETSSSNGAAPELGGLEIRNGALEYLDATQGTRVTLRQWRLDLGEWRADEPFSLSTAFELRSDDDTKAFIPVTMKLPEIRIGSAPLTVSIPQLEAKIANAALGGSLMLDSAQPLRAQGTFQLETASLRELLQDLAVGGPRPRDAATLGELKMKAQWAVLNGAFAVKPLEFRLDETNFQGEAARPPGDQAILSFGLRGDRIALDRYVQIEDTGSEPFVLPTASLRALRVAGVISFAEAQMAGARIENARLRIETQGVAP